MLISVASLTEAFAAVTTCVIPLLQVHGLQVALRFRLILQEAAAEATHPATVVHHSEAVLEGLKQEIELMISLFKLT